MAKTYKVTYKTYLNNRLKQVFFHGELTFPLYVQITFDRKTMPFKSYYFDLFSKPRYVLFAAGKRRNPTLDDIIREENALIDFVVDKCLDDFSLERFSELYAYYGKDICDETEAGFIDYLFTFFNDKGMPSLATTLKEGGKLRVVYDVVRDLKNALTPGLYKELIESSFYYAPPYLPLFGFMMQFKKWPMLCLTVREWDDAKTREGFTAYVSKQYPEQDAADVTRQVDQWLAHLRKVQKKAQRL